MALIFAAVPKPRRNQMTISRRRFLGQSAALVCAAQLAEATTGPEHLPTGTNNYDLLLARVSSLPIWNFGPGGDRNFLARLADELGLRVKLQHGVKDWEPEIGKPDQFNAVVNLESLDSMQRFPILFMMGMGKWRLLPQHQQNLKQYIENGGFVFMDECASPSAEDEFYVSSLNCLNAMFGNEIVRPVPGDHTIYSNVHDIPAQNFQSWKRPNGVNPDMGVFVGDRLAVYLDNADLHCGWSDPKDEIKRRTQYEEGIQRGINLFEYFLSYEKTAEV
jgi:hypothetical protein